MERRMDQVWYGVSHFGRTLPWVAADLYALYALIVVADLSPPVAGAAFLCILLFGAACDLGVGWTLDRRGPPAAPVLVAAGLASALAFVASLTAPTPWMAITAGLVFRFTYAVYDVPHNAMLKRLSRRVSPVNLSLIRFLTGAAASLAVAALATRFMQGDGRGLVSLSLAIAAPAAASMALYAPLMTGDAPWASVEGAEGPMTRTRWPTVVGLTLVALTGALLGGLVTKALVFVGEVSLGFDNWSGRALGVLTIGRLSAAPLWALAARRHGILPLIAAAFLIVALAGIVLVARPLTTMAVEFGVLLLGAGFGGVTLFSWALLPNLSTAIEQRTGRDATFSTVAAYTALNKLALGLSGGLMAALLAEPLSWGGLTWPLPRNLGLTLTVGATLCVLLLSRQAWPARRLG